MSCASVLRHLLLLVLVTAWPAAPLWAANFSGNYHGIAAAAGMSLSLQETGGRLVGRLAAADGRSYALNGTLSKNSGASENRPDDKITRGAEGELRLGGQVLAVAFFRIEERPLGVQFLFIPVKDDGKPDISLARDYSFLAQGVSVTPKQAVVAAPAGEEKVDLLDFIDKYRQWSPRDVARIYAQLSGRDKGLIQLYDHASGDILWRVCATNPPNEFVTQPMIDEMLDRQHISCAELTPLAARAEEGRLFSEFLRRARFQFEIIRETVLCNRGQSSPSKCADVSAMGAPLIVHWRDLRSILQELVPDAAVATGEPSAPKRDAVAATDEKEAGHQLPLPALRTSIAEVPGATRAHAGVGKEGRLIVKLRRRGLRLPLRDPRS
jgi:hypothetical protein